MFNCQSSVTLNNIVTLNVRVTFALPTTSMPTPAQAPPQEAQEETAFQRFAKVAQVRIHSFSLTVVTNFLPFVANTIGLPILPSRYDKAFLFSTCNVPQVTHS